MALKDKKIKSISNRVVMFVLTFLISTTTRYEHFSVMDVVKIKIHNKL